MTTFTTKDSGHHQQYESGMRRDSQDGKPRFDLIRTKLQPYEEQMITRYARLLARGAEKYSARNWEEGCGEEELERAKASLLRHTEQLVAGETDEDHAAAVWFNTQAVEYFRWRLESPQNDGLTGRERLAKAARASEIHQAALQEAAKMRRRERLTVAAKDLDAELTEDAKRLRESVEANRPVPASQQRSGAVGLFQFVSPDWAAQQEKLGQQIADNVRRRYAMPTRFIAGGAQPELPYDEIDQN